MTRCSCCVLEVLLNNPNRYEADLFLDITGAREAVESRAPRSRRARFGSCSCVLGAGWFGVRRAYPGRIGVRRSHLCSEPNAWAHTPVGARTLADSQAFGGDVGREAVVFVRLKDSQQCLYVRCKDLVHLSIGWVVVGRSDVDWLAPANVDVAIPGHEPWKGPLAQYRHKGDAGDTEDGPREDSAHLTKGGVYAWFSPKMYAGSSGMPCFMWRVG